MEAPESMETVLEDRTPAPPELARSPCPTGPPGRGCRHGADLSFAPFGAKVPREASSASCAFSSLAASA
jgi:hypothetical protein